MFNLPTNNTDNIRTNVVDAFTEAFFCKKSYYWCDDMVFLDTRRFVADYDKREQGYFDRPTATPSRNEIDEAFAQFRSKGWHILRSDWYSSCNGRHLWAYHLVNVIPSNLNGDRVVF